MPHIISSSCIPQKAEILLSGYLQRVNLSPLFSVLFNISILTFFFHMNLITLTLQFLFLGKKIIQCLQPAQLWRLSRYLLPRNSVSSEHSSAWIIQSKRKQIDLGHFYFIFFVFQDAIAISCGLHEMSLHFLTRFFTFIKAISITPNSKCIFLRA